MMSHGIKVLRNTQLKKTKTKVVCFFFVLSGSVQMLCVHEWKPVLLDVTAVSMHAKSCARNTLFTVKDSPCVCNRKFCKIYSIFQVRKKNNHLLKKQNISYKARSAANLDIYLCRDTAIQICGETRSNCSIAKLCHWHTHTHGYYLLQSSTPTSCWWHDGNALENLLENVDFYTTEKRLSTWSNSSVFCFCGRPTATAKNSYSVFPPMQHAVL